nr:MAG TPA: hypothetical protein [Caudoviricetes sp.]
MFNESTPLHGLEEMFNESTHPHGLEEMRARNQACDMLSDMLIEAMLKSDAPEEAKLGVRIVQQGKKVSKATQEIIEAFVGDSAAIKASDTKTLKKVLEYLGLVEVGLKQFMEITKAPNTNNAPNEI